MALLALSRYAYTREERKDMIKIKMTYDKDTEVVELLELMKDKIDVARIKHVPDERRKRLCIWGEKKK